MKADCDTVKPGNGSLNRVEYETRDYFIKKKKNCYLGHLN